MLFGGGEEGGRGARALANDGGVGVSGRVRGEFEGI